MLTNIAARIRDWCARAPQRAHHLTSALLGAFIVVELIRLSSEFRHSAADAPPPRGDVAQVASMPTASYGTRIVAAHLFGVAVDTRLQTDQAPPLSATLVLDGTIATRDPKRGFAIIHDAGEAATVYAVGQTKRGVSLQSVYQDHVIVDRQGILETLRLPRSPLTAGAQPVEHTAGKNQAAKRLYVDNRGRSVDKPPGPLDQVVRTVTSFDADGQKLRGFYVYPVASGDPLRAMGLYPGDLLTAINGTRLDDLKRSQEVLGSLGKSAQVSVTFERQGQTQTATFNMGEALQAAAPE